MITFRFYVVSVVAFFLAIAVGVVLGSALDGRISDSLKDRLERVEGNLDATVDVIDEKNDRIDELTTFADEVMTHAVKGRLAGTNTLVVAQAGIEPDQVARVLRAIGAAGSATPGVMWVEEGWDPADPSFVREIRTVLDANDVTIGKVGVEEAVWSAVLDAITAADEPHPSGEPPATTEPDTEDDAEVAAPPEPSDPVDPPESGDAPDDSDRTTPATTDDPTPDQHGSQDDSADGAEDVVTGGLPVQEWWNQALLTDLAATTVIELHSSGQVEGDPGALNIVIVVGVGSELDNDESEMISLVEVAAARGVPLVIAGVGTDDDHDDDVEGEVLPSLIRSVDAGVVSAVERVDRPGGDTAVVAALFNAARNEFGVFGIGRMATSVLPPLLGDDGGQ